ncbi:response regulator [Thermodesulfobacteriota bacterium]
MPNVLVAEDDRILRKRIMRAITNQSAEVAIHETDNGKEAIKLIERFLAKGQPMDVVITDIQMPEVSGLMLLAFLNAFAPKVPCFVISAYGTARLKSKMPSDLLRFYDKPFDVDKLAISVVAALSRRRDPNTCGGINLPDFINLAAIDRATATITVTQEEHPSSKLFLKDGELIDAITGDERGEPAAILAMSWLSANYSIDFGIPDDIERTITTPLTQLLRTVSECFDNA